MQNNSNRLSQFWQELKRRNVVRVLMVYAGAAYVIIELISNITEPLRLPEWTPTLIIVLLAIGFPIVIIFSWIYDIRPEGGLVKTEPADKVKEEEIPKSSNGWKIASYISFAVIVALIVFNISSTSNKSRKMANLEKSIAVLPFENMSDDASYSYLGGAFTDEIILELQKIKAFDRVLSRTSTMQYEQNRPTIPEIAAKLNVNYLIEGSIQRFEENVRVRVQVIRADEEDHIWGGKYESKWEDIFSIQDEIAYQVASQLKMVLSPDEVERIDQKPTTNFTAYDFYMRGLREHDNYRDNYTDEIGRKNALDKATLLYQLALDYDSSFAKAYTGLAFAYRDKHYQETYFEEDFLDSSLSLANIALRYNNQLEEAYRIRGDYFLQRGKYYEALKEYESVLEFNPNYWQAYSGLAAIHWWTCDHVKRVENRFKVIELNRGKELPGLLRTLGNDFTDLGMEDYAHHYYEDAFKIDNDTGANSRCLKYIEERHEYELGKKLFEIRIEVEKQRLAEDPTLNRNYPLAYYYSVLGNHEEAYKFFKKYTDQLEGSDSRGLSSLHRVGYGYWMAGHKEQAKIYFDEHLFHCKESIKLNRSYANRKGAFYDLAGYYAFFNEYDSAYYYLDRFVNELCFFGSYWFYWIFYDPMFNNIREQARFQEIIRMMKVKNQNERDAVIAWLENKNLILYI